MIPIGPITRSRHAYREWLATLKLADSEDAKGVFLKDFKGEWASKESYAQRYVALKHDVSALPEGVRPHIDYKSIAHHLFWGRFYAINAGSHGIYVFESS